MAQFAKPRSAVFLFIVVLVGPIWVDAQRPLFSPAVPPQSSALSVETGAIRLRYVMIDVDRIRNSKIVNSDSSALLLNLFPDASYEAVLHRVDRIGDSLVW